MRCIYGCKLTGGRKNSGRRASCEWERLNAEEGKGECNQERRRAGMEPGTGRNAGISFSSNPCWGRGCLHVGEAMYRPVGEWEAGSHGDDGAVVAAVHTACGPSSIQTGPGCRAVHPKPPTPSHPDASAHNFMSSL